MTVAGNIGSAMEVASTGLIVMGASVPLGMLKNMADGNESTRRKRKRKTKRSRK